MSDKKENSNPYLSGLVASGDDLPLLSPEPPSQESSADSNVSLQGISQESPQDFQESSALFSEIRNFGETGQSSHNESPSIQSFSESPSAAALVQGPRSGILLSTAQSVSGFAVEQHLGLVSAWCAFSPTAADPIAEARAQLEKNAAGLGANAILSVQIQPLSNPEPGLLLTGTAVIVKESP